MKAVELRKKLIAYINTSDEQSLKDLYDFAMQNAGISSDVFDMLPKDVQILIDKGLNDIE